MLLCWLFGYCVHRKYQMMSGSPLIHSPSVTLTIPPGKRKQSTAYTKTLTSKPSEMRQRWSLGILYLLQLMVLTGVVATYILNNSSHHKPPEALRLPPKSQTPSSYTYENFTSAFTLGPISMADLMDNIHNVTNLYEFFRMFNTSAASDDNSSHTLELKDPATEDDATLPKKRRRKKGGKPISPHGADHNGGHEDESKTKGYARLGAQDLSSDEMDALANKTAVNLQHVSLGAADEDSMEYQKDAPAAGDISWSLNTEVLQAAINHLHNYESDAASFTCREPTAYVHRLLRPMAVVLPDCIKLYRCMNFTGCCKYPAVCSPKKIQIVKRAFLIFHYQPAYPRNVHAKDVEGSLMTFENHTECECVLPNTLPQSCHKRCPAPFILNVELSQCTCICPQTYHDQLLECTLILQGVKQLDEKGLECIKAAKCYYPKCERGSFDVATGLCPLAPEWALPSYMFQNPVNHADYRSHIPGFGTRTTGPKVTHPFKVLSTTKSPRRVQNEKDEARKQARLKPHMSSVFHEGHRHQPLRTPKPTPKPKLDVGSKVNSTVEIAKAYAKIPNPGMSGSYHENYRPYRPIPTTTEKVKKSENSSFDSSNQNVTQRTDYIFAKLSNTTDSNPKSAKNNKSRLGIPEGDLPVNNKSGLGIPVDDFPVNNKSGLGIPVDEIPVNNKSGLVIPVDDFPVNNKSGLGIPVDDFPVNNKSGLGIPVDDVPVNNKSELGIPVDDVPVNNTSGLGIPVDDFPVNSSTELNGDSRNASIVLNTISVPQAKGAAGLDEIVTGNNKAKPDLEEERQNRPRSLPSPQDVDQSTDAAKDLAPPDDSTARERPSPPDVAPDQDDGSTDPGQQEGSSNGGDRGPPVDQQEDKGAEGSGQD